MLMPKLKDRMEPVNNGYPMSFQSYYLCFTTIAWSYQKEGEFTKAKEWIEKPRPGLLAERDKLQQMKEEYPYQKLHGWIDGRLQALEKMLSNVSAGKKTNY